MVMNEDPAEFHFRNPWNNGAQVHLKSSVSWISKVAFLSFYLILGLDISLLMFVRL